jgi:hypothetical protein
MTTANSTSIQGLGYPSARFNEKGCLQVRGGDALSTYLSIFNTAQLHSIVTL